MPEYKPDHEIWKRVHQVILGENTAAVVVTLLSGICTLLVDAGIVETEADARAHLAAMLISTSEEIEQLRARVIKLEKYVEAAIRSTGAHMATCPCQWCDVKRASRAVRPLTVKP